jgi:hypothetical protein
MSWFQELLARIGGRSSASPPDRGIERTPDVLATPDEQSQVGDLQGEQQDALVDEGKVKPPD